MARCTTPERLASDVYEAARRPLAEEAAGQYTRGFLTYWEFICALTEIDVQLEKEKAVHGQYLCALCGNTAREADCEPRTAEWLVDGALSQVSTYLACTDCARPSASSANLTFLA